MFILRSYSGIALAWFGSLPLALSAAAAGSFRRGYVCEVWQRHQDDAGGVDELVVTYRGPN